MTTGQTLQVSRLLHPITTLGPGRRVGLWVQGCTLACARCASIDTWDPLGGERIPVDELAELIDGILADHPDCTGVTITGGEPLQQAAALTELLRRLRLRWATRGVTVDVLLFTGYAGRAATARASSVLAEIDLLVAGPYRPAAGYGDALRASANQQVEALTELGRERLSNAPAAPALQVSSDGSELSLVGLPRPGDLDRMREHLAAAGVAMTSVSWRP